MEDPGLEALKERGFSAETPSSHQQHRHSRRLTTNRNKMLHTRYSLNLPDKFPEHRIITSAERTERTISKSVADLAWEIAVLEEEVVRKELHLLSLYRAAFDQYLGVSPRASALHTQELSRSSSGRSSLANFLSASITEYVPKISCKLSEDILRCISAVYCKLASKPLKEAKFEPSSTPSFSSASSSFSLKYPVDSWSPRCHYNVDTTSDAYGSFDGSNVQYTGMIIFPRIHIDEDKFEYASKMLDTIRTLIKRLEKIDPTKMEHEEQLCFWINIHNALLMHAFMAYGLQEKRMKSTDMILKVRLYTAKKLPPTGASQD
ncbi:hypothetical protein SETIT_5G414200v2 [Setaria italica]|uniref:DUF547 domain-containing protein n=1 Tax=Setaria italica TaxID=4555 RepID=A0A368REI3_SETIT|nr:hypothetical protein SETIT_5G414200v2 [Setaria italica]